MRWLFKQLALWMLRQSLRVLIATRPSRKLDEQATLGEVKKILVFAYHGLGNFILFLPALRELRAQFPRATIDLQYGSETGFETIARESEVFDSFFPVRRDASWREWRQRSREVRAAGYDLMIAEFHGNFPRLALLIARSRSPCRLGHVTSPGWRNEWSFLYNIPVVMRETQHEVDRYLALLSPLGCNPQLRDRVPAIEPSRDASQRAARLLHECGIDDTERIIGFQVGTSPTMRWKQWGLEKYSQLLAQLASELEDVRFVFLGSSDERQMADQVVGELVHRGVNLAGLTTVDEAAAILRRCELLVCNDSGLMHLAAAVGTRVVAIYGPTDLSRTQPLGSGHRIVRTGIPCSPCFKLEGSALLDACSHKDCLVRLPVSMVRAAVGESFE